MRTLGIDFGSKRVGIALSDESGNFALPYGVIENNTNLVQEIKELCQINNVSEIVIGESKDFNGNDNIIMKDIRLFVDKIKEQTNIPINFHPEFMTSAQAEQIQGKNDMLDASAASLILGSYLEFKKNHDNN